MADQQGHLHGAYYGPPVPPRKEFRSVGRGSGCNPFSCLICTLFKFIISIIILLGIIVLVLWLIFRPNHIKAYVPEASLTQFNYNTNNSNLQYNLDLNMTIRNPNKRISLYYDYIEANVYYDSSRFGFNNSISPFYQDTKTTSTFDVNLNGTNVLSGDSSSLSTTYNKEKNDGFYNVELKVRTNIRLKVWFFKIHYKRQKIDCSLKLPVPGSSNKYEGSTCDVDIF